VPVDPGEQLIEAVAPGYQPYSQRITVDKQSGTVTVPALIKAVSSEPAISKAPAPPPTAAPMSPSLPSPDEPPPPSSAQSAAGITLGVVGLVGIGAGTYFGLHARAKNNDAKDICPVPPKCPTQDGADLGDQANRAAVLSNVTFAVGGAALVAGGLLLLTAPTKRHQSGLDFRFVPVAGARELGAQVAGSF